MAANQLKAPSIVLGYMQATFAGDTTLALSAAATWLAMGFVPNATKTIANVKLFLDTKTGSPTTAGCTLDIFSDSSGIPNASIEGPISSDSVPASGNWMQWTLAGTTSLTGDTQYWAVFKNGTATPASNFPTYRFQSGLSAGLGPVPFQYGSVGGGAILNGWCKVHTLNSGTAWASSAQGGVSGLRIQYTDGTYEGFPIQTSLRPSNGTTSDRAFGKQEVGVKFNIPAGVTFNVARVGFPLFRTSTPGNVVFHLWQGVTLIGTSNAITSTDIATASGDWYFATLTTFQPIVSTNQPFRLTFSDATAADTNTKGYNSQLYTFENDVNSLALKPMNGTLQKTITADNTANPVVFTDTATDVMPFAMLLDSIGGELTGSSSGVIVIEDD